VADEVLLIGMLGLIVIVITSISSLAYWLGRKFVHIDERFTQIDDKFAQVDKRFAQIDERLAQTDKRFAQIDNRFEQVDKRFVQIDERFKYVEGVMEDINARGRRMEERLNVIVRSINDIIESTKNQLEFFAEFLGFRKILDVRDVMFVKNELVRLSAMSLVNPLTKEEAQRLKELINKEKLSLQEADELRNIARKLVSEYGGKIPEVWKLLIYASIMRGIALSELEEEKK
jgi:DNA repair exonuclease SbcCD ATPase subunit